MHLTIFKSRHLPVDIESQLLSQHESEIRDLLPVLGPLFGLGAAMFTVWNHLIDPAHASTTLPVRAGFVLPGAAAYWPTGLCRTLITPDVKLSRTT